MRLVCKLAFMSSVFFGLARHASAEGQQCCLRGFVSEATISKVSVKFKETIHNSGISGVSKTIQSCYDNSKTLRATSECMLFDMAAYGLDQGMQVVFTARGWNPMAGSTPLLTGQAFHARLEMYSYEVFGSEQAAKAYFGNAAAKVIDNLNR